MNDVGKNINEFIKQRAWAVVGASPKPEKAGHQIYHDLKEAGYQVYPVNPNAKDILGDPVYPSLSDVPATPDVVDLVVPPLIAFQVVKEADSLGIKRIWFQPMTESPEAIKYCREYGIKYVAYVCVMKDMLKSR